MKARDLAYETISALDSNRGRSLLTVLGIVIGISAVITMTALIGGIKQAMIGSLGLTQARMVTMGVWSDRGVTLDDIEQVKELLPQYEYISASVSTEAEAKNGRKSSSPFVRGVQPSFFKVTGTQLVEGRFITEQDDESGSFVCVLDQGSVRQLYGRPDESVVGNTIRLNDMTFTIVGVTMSEDSFMDESGTIYLPLSTCVKRIAGYEEISDIRGLVYEGVDMSTIADETTAVLSSYFGIEPMEEGEEFDGGSYGDIFVMTMQSVIDQLDSTTASFQLMMTVVASISLVVGGIGIMNMMLTNVTERIREIGLRKALGARSSDITTQFLLESVCLCLAGGVVGILAGYLASFGLTDLLGGALSAGIGFGELAGDITPVIDVQSVGMATGICVLIGVIFGYYPARRAAKLDPVESLHYQ